MSKLVRRIKWSIWAVGRVFHYCKGSDKNFFWHWKMMKPLDSTHVE